MDLTVGVGVGWVGGVARPFDAIGIGGRTQTGLTGIVGRPIGLV